MVGVWGEVAFDRGAFPRYLGVRGASTRTTIYEFTNTQTQFGLEGESWTIPIPHQRSSLSVEGVRGCRRTGGGSRRM